MLEVKGLSFGKILKGISFKAEAGQVIGVLGKNGAGKSTLLKCLGGFYSYEGEVKLFGRELSSIPLRERVKLVNYLPQSFNPTFDYKVKEFLYLSTGVEVDDATLSKFGVLKLKERKLSLLSGGERVKVLLSRLELISPSVYLLDEPSAYLDPCVISLLTSYVRELSEKRKIVFIVSHDVDFVFKVSNLFLGIKEGELLFFEKRKGAKEKLEELFECQLENKEVVDEEKTNSFKPNCPNR